MTASGTFPVDGRYSYDLAQLVALVNRARTTRGEGPVAVAGNSES